VQFLYKRRQRSARGRVMVIFGAKIQIETEPFQVNVVAVMRDIVLPQQAAISAFQLLAEFKHRVMKFLYMMILWYTIQLAFVVYSHFCLVCQ